MLKSLRYTILFFITHSIFSLNLFGQEDPSLFLFQIENQLSLHNTNSNNIEPANPHSFNWHDPITQLPKDFLSFGEKAFNANNINSIAGLAILTGALISIDHETIVPFRFAYKTSETMHEMCQNISWFGGGEFHIILASVFGGAGFVLDDQRALRTALQIVEAEIATGLTVQLLKHISGRESPQSASHFHGLFRPFPNIHEYHADETKYYSFPSGHISTSVAVLTVIADNYPHVSWIKPVGYSVIGLIGIGLVARGWHWFSDYPLAAAIGYVYGKIISGRNDILNIQDEENSQWLLHPDYTNGLGVGITYRF